MLVLHSSSRCDVCLIEYSWEDTAKKPHAIACGHIFCRDCLYSNSPPLCPLCRKAYQPAKIKRLHVDKPDAMEDTKDLDLLQRLALAWECPPEQLKDITEEVDAWLRDRPDNKYVALRRARAALLKNAELRAFSENLHDHFVELQQRHNTLEINLQNEQQKGLIQAEANTTMIDGLNKEVVRLTFQLEGMLAYSHRHSHSHKHKSRNPLPPPPEPISTDKIPTFEQAMEQAILESGAAGARPIDLPSSLYRQPYEGENRGHSKGKSRENDPWLEKESRYRSTSPPQFQEGSSMPPLPASAAYHVHPHSSSQLSQLPQYHPAYSTLSSTRAATLPTLPPFGDPRFFDVFNTMGGYLKEYTTGYLNGQEAALAQKMTEEWNRRAAKAASSKAASSSARRYTEQQPAIASIAPELNGTYRHTSTATHGVPNSPPHTSSGRERSSRSSRRPETASSIISSSVGSSRHDRTSPTAQTRSSALNGTPSVPIHHVQSPVNPPAPSEHSVVPSESVVRSPSPRSLVVSPLPVPLPLQPQQIIPQQPIIMPAPAVTPTPYRPPSIMSHQTHPSIDTWGTPPPSHLASGSLVSGLLGLREGAESAMVGGQGSFVFRELNSHGSSIRSRNSIVEGMDVVLEAPNPDFSPSRPVQTMVGVLPDEAAPPYVRSPRDGERPPSYLSQIYSPNHDQYQPASPGHNRSRQNGRSGYQNDIDGTQRHYYRSSGSGQNERSSQSSSRGYAAIHEDGLQLSSHQDDQHSIGSSLSSLALRGPPPSRLQPLSLPDESPLPGSMQYTDSEDGLSSMDGHRRSASRTDSIEETTESFNNALCLDF